MFSILYNEQVISKMLQWQSAILKADLLSFCLKASSSNILSRVVSASGSLELQQM